MGTRSGKETRKPTEPEKQVTIFSLKGSDEMRAWMRNLSDETMISYTKIVRASLAMWAESRGFKPPPKL